MTEIDNLATILRAVLALACIFLPGAAILAWLPMKGRTLPERLAVAFGLGIALIALGALLGRLAAFQFSAALLIILAILCALAALVGILRRGIHVQFSFFDLLAFSILAAILALRFYQVRELVFPPWVDSVHHAFLVRVFLERGGLPVDLSPWIPGPFYYHFGFHSAAAVFAAFSGLAPDRVLLVFGQILGAMAALSVYRFSMALRRDARRAIFAMAIAGFVTQMPAFYLAWGRYTLLAGMVLLPLAMAEAVELAYRAPRPAAGLRLALLTAGVLLTHYLAGLMLAAFLGLMGFSILWKKDRRPRIIALAAASFAGAVLALPWLIPMLRSAAPNINLGLVTPADPLDTIYFNDYTGYLWRLLGPVRNYIVVAAGLVAALVALLRRGPMRPFALWGLFLGLQALPWGLRIAPFRPDHLVIVLYLPAAILLADLWIACADFLDEKKPVLHPKWWMAAAGAALCLYGSWDTRNIVKPTTIFADSFDREAVEWAERNTPADSLFLINVTPWQSGLYRGVDGGWWLLPLADRRTLLPPMLYSFADRDYIASVNRVAEQTVALSGCSPEFWSLVEEQGVGYLYVREDVGSLRPETLALCQGLERVYQNEKVSIFRIISRG